MEGPPADAELYRYTEIESNSSFRLLKLLKGNGPELECELYPWLIQDEYPSYEALSYTWGSSEVVECIALNQKPFWITDNLHTALQSLRLRDRDRILWIDAICIKQGDKLEQSHQVQQMGQIYGQAEKVLFWLGKATPQIIALMETLNQHPYNSSASHNMQEVFKDWPYEGHSIGFQQLLNREWFTRVWIVQEAAKARKADVCCGIRSIPAELFVRAFHLMKQEPPPHCKPVLDIMAESLRTGSWWTQARDLRILLQKFHASKATDERDKIYALLAKPQEDASEIIFPYLQTGYMISDRSRPENTTQPIAAFNNPALFIVEERPAANLENSKTCYSQAVKLMLDQLSGRDPPDGGLSQEDFINLPGNCYI
ncbi:ankyrin repeat and sam domain-containing protein 6 [Stemphylium lycopersici]|nr:ankyrin repeat and sam domain-containing protein 6 [Stemphylium lycopersici]